MNLEYSSPTGYWQSHTHDIRPRVEQPQDGQQQSEYTHARLVISQTQNPAHDPPSQTVDAEAPPPYDALFPSGIRL